MIHAREPYHSISVPLSYTDNIVFSGSNYNLTYHFSTFKKYCQKDTIMIDLSEREITQLPKLYWNLYKHVTPLKHEWLFSHFYTEVGNQ